MNTRLLLAVSACLLAQVPAHAINAQERVWVNGKRVKTWRSDGALVFHDAPITYTIQGDRRLQGEDSWVDRDAGTHGLIFTE